METILVTGCSGYLGGVLCKRLKESNYVVIGFDIRTPDHNYYETFIQGDVTEFSSLYSVFSEYKLDAVCHLAGRIEVSESQKHPTEFWRTNVNGTTNILHLMKKFNVNRLLFSSTAAVYWPSNLPIRENELKSNNSIYGETKKACEMAIRDSGIPHVIFRYFNLAGAEKELGENHEIETHVIPNILNHTDDFIIFGDDHNTPDGTCIRDYVHVSDVADAHILGLKYLTSQPDFITLNLGTGKGHSILELINLIESELGIKVNYRYGKRRVGDPPILIANIKSAKEVLKYEPKHDIISILKTAYDWHKLNDTKKKN